MNNKLFSTFGQMTYGIYILTSKYKADINGMVASWVTQVSYEPPLILVSVHPNRYSHDLILKGGAFGLHILDISQKDMLKRFKGPDNNQKFIDIAWEAKKTGVPILRNCLAWFDCKVTDHTTPGNHSLFIGEVEESGAESSGTPLCTQEYDGMYTGKN